MLLIVPRRGNATYQAWCHPTCQHFLEFAQKLLGPRKSASRILSSIIHPGCPIDPNDGSFILLIRTIESISVASVCLVIDWAQRGDHFPNTANEIDWDKSMLIDVRFLRGGGYSNFQHAFVVVFFKCQPSFLVLNFLLTLHTKSWSCALA